MQDRSSMPNKKEMLCANYEFLISNFGKFWLDVLHDDIPLSEKTSYCFACGSNVGTERCHIIALDNSGTNELDNLHLLCKECHLESENFKPVDLYWEWFKSKAPSSSGSNLRLKNKAELYLRLFNEGKGDLIPIEIHNFIKQYIK